MSDSLWPHGLQHARLPCPSPTPRACSNLCPSSGDAIQPSHLPLSPFPPAFHLSQHQGLFQWVSSSHKVAKVLEFQLQHQSFQWIFRTEMLKCKNSAPGEFKWFQTVRNLLSKWTCSIESFCVWGQLYTWVENLPAVETHWFLGQEDPLEKEIATHSSILVWRVSWTVEPGGLSSVGLQRVGHDWATNTFTFTQMGVLPINFYITFLIYEIMHNKNVPFEAYIYSIKT